MDVNSTEPYYEEGVVAIIDALGSRGIWSRADPIQLIKTLTEIVSLAVDKGLARSPALSRWYEENAISPDVLILSDSIFIGMHIRPTPKGEYLSGRVPDDLVLLAFRTVRAIAANIIKGIAQSECPLVYRGCIAYGNYACVHNMIIGPAVDEAAEFHQLAEAAVVYFCPSALRCFESRSPSEVDLDWYFPAYPVFLKGGHCEMTRIMNPLSRFDPDQLVEQMLGTFYPSCKTNASVALKEANTRSLYEFIRKQSAIFGSIE